MSEPAKKLRKPDEGAFKQQRLPAWQPVLTPRTVLPTLFIIGIIFTPIGGLLYWSSGRANEIMLNYSHCGLYETPVYMEPSMISYEFSPAVDISTMEMPAYHYQTTSEFLDPTWKNPNQLTIKQCVIDFTVPSTMTGPVFMYYRLTNFYQNRRQYIKSYDADQLLGKAISSSTAQSNCDPAGQTEEGLIVYPCGLIANSMFNDTFSNITQIDGDNAVLYEFSSTNVAWPTDTEKYKLTTYPIDAIAPPPNWVLRYPNGKYDQDHPPPDLSTMERFMVWMHVAALPDFRKLWGRNDNQDLPAGRWRILVDMNFDTVQYKGTKWIVLSTTTALGGRNLRLGVTYISIGSICLALGVFFSIRQSARPRKLGDQAYLSWNQPGGGLPSNVARLARLHQD
ncbi:hypothetical protein PHYBLDRAFT_164593 [Phycomyces blakesleeanus NRRL 1555(-)]|uniref:Uncharacterized protein n=1 Tax=Phycomyces blakesleeanus (strain ATCC 8743b / DSM 1359 / FGSC 10004 / NBRC 33097 / NRRL 1555) TaxID=763407 RepID=A0A167PD54_PHYB8|nr:hypothetical protein PHYBLDRAFT_164593 [Phycomyces blakesleeanus NRRL 1555(-)]OAD77697.1 hypothetical protein PHYBLDRAFT_164593 [Phycomyces blakesleeanus NRRL 1555(-)]|eukprot:XP_018295737.1 hypothetical protein PHYBLDRAFT_164593 [Phycomyces blakesleeanus NRRL 1555(-)]